MKQPEIVAVDSGYCLSRGATNMQVSFFSLLSLAHTASKQNKLF